MRVQDVEGGGTESHWTCSRCYTVLDSDKESPRRTESREEALEWLNRKRVSTWIWVRWTRLSRWWKNWRNRHNLTCDSCKGTGECPYCNGKGWDSEW